MTDVALNNPIVTAVQAIKSGNDVVPVSSSNPLSVLLTEISSSGAANALGKMYSGKITCSAVAAKYSACQIWNPANSGKDLIVYLATGYNSAGTVTWNVLPNVSTPLTTSGGTIINNKFGGAATSFELRTQNLDALTANPFYTPSNASIVAPGTSLMISQQVYTIAPSTGLQFEQATVNIGANLLCVIAETLHQ